MNIVLWIAQSLLALLLIAGGGYKVMGAGELAAQFAAVPLTAWRAIGIIELIGGLLIIVPWALRWMPHLTAIAAMVLLVETLMLCVIYGRQSLALTPQNPLVFSVVMAVMLAFVAYGRR